MRSSPARSRRPFRDPATVPAWTSDHRAPHARRCEVRLLRRLRLEPPTLTKALPAAMQLASSARARSPPARTTCSRPRGERRGTGAVARSGRRAEWSDAVRRRASATPRPVPDRPPIPRSRRSCASSCRRASRTSAARARLPRCATRRQERDDCGLVLEIRRRGARMTLLLDDKSGASRSAWSTTSGSTSRGDRARRHPLSSKASCDSASSSRTGASMRASSSRSTRCACARRGGC